MQKSKTKRKFMFLISALLSTIFAFSIGYTFASINLVLSYSSNPKAATAYIGNNQYVVNNDTELSPVAYSVGSHSTDVSLQYAIDYEFDLRVKYSLDWLGDEGLGSSLSTNNVKLIFANRDNVIVDDTYIYYINYNKETIVNGDDETVVSTPCGLAAGDGKISLIAGVEIIETYNEEYKGKSLKIKIDEVKIVKTGEGNYQSSSHPLYNSGKAGSAWVNHKISKTNQVSSAYVMFYNYRYNVNNGVSYPGHNSAYSKLGDGEIVGNWLGGNKAYGGIGAYIITSAYPVKLTARIKGTWQDNENSESAGIQFDNSIRFNYAEGWKHLEYDQNKLFETCYYEYEIPAYTACYIDIIESVEITCAHNVSHNNFDAYSLVAYECVLNGATFQANKIQAATISSSTETFETVGQYSSKNIEIINTGKYSNNMYEYKLGTKTIQNFNNSSILLVNNTATEKQLKITYSCNYYISNGVKLLVLTGSGERASKFSDGAYYRLEGKVNNSGCSLPSTITYVVPAYSSVNIDADYSVNGNFQDVVLVDQLNKRDAWVELNASVEEEEIAANSNLAVEVLTNNSTASVRIKNNTNKTITSINANIKIYNYKLVLNENVEPSKPNDWDATFWRYYSISNGKPVQNESKDWRGGVFYKGSYLTEEVDLYNLDGSKDSNDGTIVKTGIALKPNESLVVYTFTVDNESEIINKSVATAEGEVANTLTMVVDNVTNPYLINYSSQSLFVRLTGTIPNGSTVKNTVVVGGYIYFTKVIQPGEIVEIPSTVTALAAVDATADYVPDEDGTLKDWDSEIINIFDLYFK